MSLDSLQISQNIFLTNMKHERESSPIQSVVNPMKGLDDQNPSSDMDYILSGQDSHQDICDMSTNQDNSVSPVGHNSESQSQSCIMEDNSATQSHQFYNPIENVSQHSYSSSVFKYPSSVSHIQENLNQLEGGISKLQQDMSLVRISNDGTDSSLQNLYLERLQELVPWVPNDEELPKLQLVQAVIDYIHLLQDQLEVGACNNGHSAEAADISYCSDEMSIPITPSREPMNSNSTHLHFNGVGLNSCHHSSSSSLSPSPSSSLPAQTAGQPHLLHDLEQKHLANELYQLHDAQRSTPEKSSSQQHMFENFIDQHGIIDDLRHMRTKNAVYTRQHMVMSPVEGGAGGEGDAGATLERAISGTHASRALSQPPCHFCPHDQGCQHYGAASVDRAVCSGLPVFPFPAPPSPKSIRAARKKKQQLRKLQELQGQQDDVFHMYASNCSSQTAA